MKFNNDSNAKILDLLRGQAVSFPATTQFYYGLVSSTGQEVVAGSYSRKLVAANTNSWYSTQNTLGEVSNGTGRSIKSNFALDFGEALEAWGAVAAVRVYYNSTGPEYLCDLGFVSPVSIWSGTHLVIDPGSLVVQG